MQIITTVVHSVIKKKCFRQVSYNMPLLSWNTAPVSHSPHQVTKSP